MAWGIRTSKSSGQPVLEVLVNPVSSEVTASIVIDASTVTVDTDGNLRLIAGTPMTKNASGQYEKYVGSAGQTARIGAGTASIGILTSTEVFPDNTAQSDLPAAIWCHGQWFRSDRLVGWAANRADAGGTIGAAIKAQLPTCKFS